MSDVAPGSGDAPAPPAPKARTTLIWIGIAAFFVACVLALFVVPRLVPESEEAPQGHAPTPRATALPDGTFRVTLDVASRAAWVGLDLGTGEVAPEESADLLLQRTVLRAPSGAASLGEVDLATASVPSDLAYEDDREIGSALQSPAFHRWYRYAYGTHQLHSKREVVAVRRRRGGVALVLIESYYCQPEGSGCMTLTYRLP